MIELIGLRDWDPTGESMLLIVQKLALRNRLRKARLSRLIGGKGPITFEAECRQDPDNPDALNLDHLQAFSGWQRHQLRASYSDYYVWPWQVNDLCRSIDVPMDDRMKLCLDCARLGDHLLIHQMMDCQRCPIHRSALITRCPACKRTLSAYRFHQFSRHALQCRHCDWSAWNGQSCPSPSAVAARLRIVEEYESWMVRIHKIINGDNDTLRWVGQPLQFQNLANVHALVPGPSWIEATMFETHRVRTSTQRFPGRLDRPITPPTPCARQYPLEQGIRHGPDIARAQFRTVRRVRSIIDEFRRRTARAQLGDLGYRREASGVLALCVTQRTSSVRTGIALWRYCVDNLLPYAERSYQSYRDQAYADAFFWRWWRQGPGSLFGDTTLAPHLGSQNTLAHRVADCWEHRVLRDSLFLLIGRASCLREERRLDPLAIGDEAVAMGGMPLFLTEQKPRTLLVHCASILAHERQWLSMIDRMPPGSTFEAVMSPEQFIPVFELLGMASYDRQQCLQKAAVERRVWVNRQAYRAGDVTVGYPSMG